MKVGIIGFGHMGRAVAKGMLYKQLLPASDILVLDPAEEAIALAESEDFQLTVCRDIQEITAKADALFWLVRKDAFYAISETIDNMPSRITNISFMAGITIAQIQEALGEEATIARAMPNIGVQNGNGVIGYTPIADQQVKDVLHGLGLAFEIPEEDIEKVTVFSGSGLGFAAYILSAYQQAGEALGFDSQLSETIAVKIFAAALDIGNFRKTAQAVATKGGCTEQGINYWEQQDLNGTIAEAMIKAYNHVAPKPIIKK